MVVGGAMELARGRGAGLAGGSLELLSTDAAQPMVSENLLVLSPIANTDADVGNALIEQGNAARVRNL